ncbi:MAG: hypothetical protein A2015_09675 [Spirochaetes bacterium GWF1_31_7]|nr:MAG: hypothetical protein A2Y30_04500 [Spirochaetes bacterium GWE1_32_154]OHD47555.1 MAG: hypothetical protein A2015_09675 [Spirochaetes bacterium GWF1_31_7]OHD52045.1 MAG: hypothetical protein A2Y29_17435 [Spirochaetes bacterium GWE2_31_10]HBD93464.1 hypothetical protein [Spirochaetia bacterium]HBI36228.1 hypothetical protein [Spirochaetia bacterium]
MGFISYLTAGAGNSIENREDIKPYKGAIIIHDNKNFTKVVDDFHYEMAKKIFNVIYENSSKFCSELIYLIKILDF